MSRFLQELFLPALYSVEVSKSSVPSRYQHLPSLIYISSWLDWARFGSWILSLDRIQRPMPICFPLSTASNSYHYDTVPRELISLDIKLCPRMHTLKAWSPNLTGPEGGYSESLIYHLIGVCLGCKVYINKSCTHYPFCVRSTKQARPKEHFLVGNMQKKTFSKKYVFLEKTSWGYSFKDSFNLKQGLNLAK